MSGKNEGNLCPVKTEMFYGWNILNKPNFPNISSFKEIEITGKTVQQMPGCHDCEHVFFIIKW